MADYQIGDNLYAEATGKYYRLNNGQKAYEESPYDQMIKRQNEIFDTQKNNQLNQLKAQREKALTGFNQQKQDYSRQYQNQRNQADVVNAQNVARLRELMAANGINASGENLTTQAQMASSRQNAFNEINNNEAVQMRDIDNQIADWNDPSREQSIVDSVETERAKALNDLMNQAQQEIYQRYMDWQNQQLEKQRIAAEQAARAAAAKKAAATKTTSSTPSAAAKTVSAAKTSSNQSALDKYYSNPIIQQMEDIKARNSAMGRLFGDPVPPAQNPNLSAWEKMKMLGL